jgi:hypothetical protein
MALRDVEDVTPYHADGEQTKFYSASDIHAIIDMASKHKTYHTTYYNSLKAYINSLSTIEEIAAITYGISIPDEYKTELFQYLDQGQKNYKAFKLVPENRRYDMSELKNIGTICSIVWVAFINLLHKLLNSFGHVLDLISEITKNISVIWSAKRSKGG